ncbi:DNA primase [Candidatus Woesearchaeota archaeon]|nr:DNA primase [Candidatus Woesearchaeota archaeon]
MAKISQVSAKYIIHSSIDIEGVVDRPDVIGAIFGQTEGLLGADLELRELQRSGRIGRIEVNVDTRGGKTKGNIVIPSSLDKAETAIVGAALEIIQRIGPCNAKIRVENIEDVRISKRTFVINRAKELLKNLMDSVMPDSQELADEVAYSVRVMEIQEYGNDRLPAGPTVDESDEVIVVEGRADVLNLLKHGIKNSIAINGTNVPETLIDLSKKKVLTAFVDGDRGGDLIIKELISVAEIDYVTKAPDGKEVEEITKKEIHKALRSKVSVEQIKLEGNGKPQFSSKPKLRPLMRQPIDEQQPQPQAQVQRPQQPRYPPQQRPQSPPQGRLSDEEKKKFKDLLEDLIGTRGAYILDDKLNILGKVPYSELLPTIKNLDSKVYAVIFDGVVDKTLVTVAEKINVTYLIAMDTKVKGSETRITLLTEANLA